jgi:hypothetical protein
MEPGEGGLGVPPSLRYGVTSERLPRRLVTS